MSSCRTLGLAVALLALTVIVYWPVKQAGFIWDDDDHVTENPAMTSPAGLVKIWSSLSVSRYYPLTLTTFWVQRRLWGLNPLPYHAVNVVLHGLNAILIYLTLRRLQVRPAWVAAAIWAIHPVNVESVAWITELKNVQSGTFFFLALLTFLRYERTGSRGWYTGSIGCAVAAVLSKSSTVILPLALLLCAWWQRRRITRRDWLRIAPFFLIALPMALLTIAEQQGRVRSQPAWSLGLVDRFGIAGRSLWFYAGKLLWPPNLSFIYPRWNVPGKSSPSWLAWLGIAAVIALGWRYRQKIWAHAGLFGFAYFAAALLPVLGFFNIFFFRYSFVADHFQYLASIGIIALACAAVASAVPPPHLRLTIASVALVSLGFLSRQHLQIFADEETLWRDTVARNPRAVIAQNNLGLVLYGQLQYRNAIECFDRALQADPNSAEAHYNLGLVLTELGQYTNAATQMRSALQIEPHFARAENGLGFALLQLGQSREATAHLRHALDLDPDCVDAHNNLGKILVSTGQSTEAEAHFRRAMQTHATDFAAHENLGVVLIQQHRLDDAVAEFREAARLKPDDPEPHKNLADVLEIQHKLTEAVQERAVAVSSAEHLGETHYRIATALESDDDLDGAIKHFRKSITFRPSNADAYLALSKVLVKQNRFVEAVTALRQGVEAVPDDPRVRNELARLLATPPGTGVRNGP
jgi:Flp pilus assembly protein TadD